MEKYTNEELDQMTNDRKYGQMSLDCYFYNLRRLNRVNPLRCELLKETKEMFPDDHIMCISLDQGEHMKTILKLMNAKKGIEVGVFTGNSAFAFAEALPDDGQLICMDISKEFTDLAQKYWKLGGLDHKIQLHLGPAIDKLDEMLADETNHNSFDFAFVDADKNNYTNYFDRLIKLIRPNGVMMFDNILWSGIVHKEMEELESDELAQHLKKAGLYIAKDERVDISTINISDGVMFCRKL